MIKKKNLRAKIEQRQLTKSSSAFPTTPTMLLLNPGALGGSPYTPQLPHQQGTVPPLPQTRLVKNGQVVGVTTTPRVPPSSSGTPTAALTPSSGGKTPKGTAVQVLPTPPSRHKPHRPSEFD